MVCQNSAILDLVKTRYGFAIVTSGDGSSCGSISNSYWVSTCNTNIDSWDNDYNSVRHDNVDQGLFKFNRMVIFEIFKIQSIC